MKNMVRQITAWFAVCLIFAVSFAFELPVFAAVTYKEITTPCDRCDGTGLYECWKCDGSGKDGSSNCPVCKGSGRYVKCRGCDGEGVIIERVKVEGSVDTEQKNIDTAPKAIDGIKTFARQNILCSKCAGTGMLECWKCDGFGKDGSSNCRVCGGTGRSINCSTCDGEGYSAGYVAALTKFETAEANTFNGTIDGESVVGYLDDTYRFRFDGTTDYNGNFVFYNSKGKAVHMLNVRVFEGTGLKTCTAKSSGGLAVNYYQELSSEQTWENACHTTDSDDWAITLKEAKYTDTGVFAGTIDVILPIDDDSDQEEIRITGSFNMQMQEVHSKARKYRKSNSKYDKANPHDFAQYDSLNEDIDSFDSSDSSSSGSSFKVDHTCRTCKGSGDCTGCGGDGSRILDDGTEMDCTRCKGTGRCQVCYGQGKVY